MRVRNAKNNELKDVVRISLQGVREIDCNPFDIDVDVLSDNIIESHFLIPALVIENDGVIIGCASLGYTKSAWSNQRAITSIMVHVLQEHRNFDIIKMLYKEIKRIAKLQGVPYIDNFTGSDKIDARARLSKAQNLKVVGINIMYDGD